MYMTFEAYLKLNYNSIQGVQVCPWSFLPQSMSQSISLQEWSKALEISLWACKNSQTLLNVQPGLDAKENATVARAEHKDWISLPLVRIQTCVRYELQWAISSSDKLFSDPQTSNCRNRHLLSLVSVFLSSPKEPMSTCNLVTYGLQSIATGVSSPWYAGWSMFSSKEMTHKAVHPLLNSYM